MIEPEIREHFLKLPLAVRGAQDFLLGELDDHLIRFLLQRIPHRGLIFVWSAVLLSFPARLDLRQFELLGDFPRAHRERPQIPEPRGSRRIRDPLGVKLLGDVPLETHGANALGVARPGAECDPVEDVKNRPVVVRERGAARSRRRDG
jgi:hypothetical protein